MTRQFRFPSVTLLSYIIFFSLSTVALSKLTATPLWSEKDCGSLESQCKLWLSISPLWHSLPFSPHFLNFSQSPLPSFLYYWFSLVASPSGTSEQEEIVKTGRKDCCYFPPRHLLSTQTEREKFPVSWEHLSVTGRCRALWLAILLCENREAWPAWKHAHLQSIMGDMRAGVESYFLLYLH